MQALPRLAQAILGAPSRGSWGGALGMAKLPLLRGSSHLCMRSYGVPDLGSGWAPTGWPQAANKACCCACAGRRLSHTGAHTQSDGAAAPIPVHLEELHEVSDTVKRFTFSDREGRLAFRAGQWVDLFPPASSGITAIGGFSFASTPQELEKEGRFQLLIRHSRHPVVDWLHTEARQGDEMHIQVGGNFFVADHHRSSPLLFLAGGIGVAPLYSMLADVLETNSATRALLLYSARTVEDFALAEEIRGLVESSERSSLQVWDAITTCPCQTDGPGAHTGQGHLIEPLGSSHRISGRMLSQGDIGDALAWLSGDGTRGSPVAYLCGPPAFADSCASHLNECGLAADKIVYEKWW